MFFRRTGYNILCLRREVDFDIDDSPEIIVVAVVSRNSRSIGDISSEITSVFTDREKEELNDFLDSHAGNQQSKDRLNHFNWSSSTFFKICESILVDMQNYDGDSSSSLYIELEKIDMQNLVDIYGLLQQILTKNQELDCLGDLYHYGEEDELQDLY